jgi:putative SOS response-associated peptidase YedK
MCGAFSLVSDLKFVAQRFNAEIPKEYYEPNYNARPTQLLPIILNSEPDKVVFSKWGLQPAWGNISKPIINARKTSLTTKRTFTKAFRERRCLVLADSFFEWGIVEGKKQPYRFMLKKEQPFAFAGLWYEGEKNKENTLTDFMIITVEPNDMVEKVHNRMPAILPINAENDWLNPDLTDEQLLNMLNPYPSNKMEVYPVTTLANSPSNNTVDIIKPARI